MNELSAVLSVARDLSESSNSQKKTASRINSDFYVENVFKKLQLIVCLGNVPYFWTSGRLCDFDGCDRPDFFPKNLNGWFWSANQVN